MSRNRMLAVLLIGAGAYAAAAGGPAAAEPRDSSAGHAIFASKQCGRCHLLRGQRGAGPALEDIRRPQGAMALAGRLWNHVPVMFVALAEQGLEWPRISAAEMADLMAYLRADAARDPAPDVARGQVALIRKGCLKCHSLRGEGGRVEPDLAEHRADYESAVAWAAAMWAHTPAMAVMASAAGVPYPRFAGAEMGNLVGFLRRAAATAGPGESTKAPGR